MKIKIISKIIKAIESDLAVLELAAGAAHTAATHEESRAEDKHDTRSVEASYLAAGQAKRTQELLKMRNILLDWNPPDMTSADLVKMGALLDLEIKGKLVHYFLCPTAGAYKVELDNIVWQVITVQTPLGEALMGKKCGDLVEIEFPQERSYLLKRIR